MIETRCGGAQLAKIRAGKSQPSGHKACYRFPPRTRTIRPLFHDEGHAMARGINKVILIGNLGADPETRAMPSGMTVANIRVATSENWKDKQSGENKERTEWHN